MCSLHLACAVGVQRGYIHNRLVKTKKQRLYYIVYLVIYAYSIAFEVISLTVR